MLQLETLMTEKSELQNILDTLLYKMDFDLYKRTSNKIADLDAEIAIVQLDLTGEEAEYVRKYNASLYRIKD